MKYCEPLTICIGYLFPFRECPYYPDSMKCFIISNKANYLMMMPSPRAHQKFTSVLYIDSLVLISQDWLRDPHDPAPTPFRFCVEFTLESRTTQCTVENRPFTHWMRYITEGFKVCVVCEPPAMRNNSGSCQGDGQDSNKYETITLYICLISVILFKV